MFEYQLTIGLYDRSTKKQIVKTEDAKRIISNVFINHYGIYAFTMIDCNGVYKMQCDNSIVHEPSIRIEIASDANIEKMLFEIIRVLKHRRMLNQESIMYKKMVSDISFR